MNQSFERTAMLIGQEGLALLQNKKVLVLGVGGVGSFVVEALARAGVGHIALCDHDEVDITNLNRQIHATMATVGQIKAEAMKDRILSINPELKVTVYPYLYNEESADRIVEPDVDYVVDAIDMVTSKLHLAQYCESRHIPLIASMGTGNKMNPTMFEVSDIYKTSVCPLAKVMRTQLRKRGVKKLKVVYSKEQPLKPLVFGTGEKDENPGEFKRRGTPGSISFVPSVAGLIIASEVIKDMLYDQSI